TNIAPATSTRVGYGNQWEAGDRVGIFMKTAGQTLSTQSALDENKQYSAAGGNLSAVGDGLHYPV
ncbi:fimbrillin family protein, partial [Alistipes sp. OttesenSCG-928-B03]|nr:fimbrillin family protein [Alistipes sp. OttesenSCG-928-B03]